ncbi:galactosylceramide sulfotransferase-like [Rhopilema esculentum]|uniref:galactosylceramide sulfotransferase-like n=1 Tax=Rhopilema esculentum TaxID=499914 RepID=UPI0031E07141
MILHRPQCFVLLISWLASFYILWIVFCKLDNTNFFKAETYRGEKNWYNDETAERNHSKRDKVVTEQPISMPLRNSSYKVSSLPVGEDIDVGKELEKIYAKQRCKPVENILFIKTHKTGSSTVTNILNRFGDLRELRMAIPSAGDYRFQWPSKFHWTFADLLRLDGETANIFCNHARYNREQMDVIMKKNTKYITILREPISQFVSSFHYFEIDKILGLRHHKNPIEEFLKDPDKYLYSLSMRLGDLPDVMNLIQSGMMYDLGYDFLEFAHSQVVKNAIKKLENELDLVLILEYFDESLVLMMRQFCWDFDDILYIKMNAMKYKKRKLNSKTREQILKWNAADVALYKRFNQTFWDKIRKQGKEFWDDVAEFKRRNADVREICSPAEVEQKAFRLNVTIKSLVLGQKVDRFHRSFCSKLMMDEVDYLDYFRYKFGRNYGYQKILAREGFDLKKTGELREKLQKMRRRSVKIIL